MYIYIYSKIVKCSGKLNFKLHYFKRKKAS